MRDEAAEAECGEAAAHDDDGLLLLERPQRAATDDDDAIEPEACKMFPIIDGKILEEPPCEDKADEIFVRRRIARRLNKILSYDDTPNPR